MTPLTLPTYVTLMRIALTVPISYLIFIGSMHLALALYVVAAMSDYVDGWLARRLQQKTLFGAMLDHVADKILVISVLLMLAATAQLSFSALVASWLIIMRELLILGLREYVSASGQTPVVVKSSARWKTALTMIALTFLLLKGSGEAGNAAFYGELFLWLSVLMSLLSGWHYMRDHRTNSS